MCYHISDCPPFMEDIRLTLIENGIDPNLDDFYSFLDNNKIWLDHWVSDPLNDFILVSKYRFQFLL